MLGVFRLIKIFENTFNEGKVIQRDIVNFRNYKLVLITYGYNLKKKNSKHQLVHKEKLNPFLG